MRWIKKEHSLTVSRAEGRSKRKLLQNLLIKWSGKASAEKAWLLYEFPFRLNPGDKPNDAQTWRNYSSLYTEDQWYQKCALFKTRPKPKVNIQLNRISRFSKSSWIETTASGLSYELGVNGAKKLVETGILLIKMDIAHFTLVNMRVSAKETAMVINILQMICIEHVLEAPGQYR